MKNEKVFIDEEFGKHIMPIDNVYRLEFTKSAAFSSIYNIDIYEFDNLLYQLRISAKEFTSIIIGVNNPGPITFITFFGDVINMEPAENDFSKITINKSISIEVNRQKLTDIFTSIIQL